jgi:hypothetical protein
MRVEFEHKYFVVKCDDVGRYPTKEEALKVLDMIQEHVDEPNNRRVFQMPEEGFSQGDGEVRI